MKKISIAASLAGLAFSTQALSATNTLIDDVVVTASRLEQPQKDVLTDITVVTQEEIQRAGANSIIDLLKNQPGLQIMNNGGSGKTSSVFLRGSNPDHVVILVDGVRVNSTTTGTTALEHLSLSQIEKIEILRGPASSLYGADAIGGVIQVFTKKSQRDSFSATAFAGIGTYNTKVAETGFSGSFADTSYALNASSYNTDGFSAKKITSGFDSDRDGYRNLSFSGSLNHKFNEHNDVGLNSFQSNSSNNYDCNSSSNPYRYSTCLMKEDLGSYSVYSKNKLSSKWTSTIKLAHGSDYLKAITGSSFSQIESDQNQYTWQNDFASPIGNFTLAYDRIEQEAVSGANHYTRTNNGYLVSYHLKADSQTFQFSLRNDDNSVYGQHLTGGIGYGYDLSEKWKATVNFGTAFKAPTFNQLYSSLGDPNLKPEESKNGEISLRYRGEDLRSSITIFDNKIKNLISFTGPGYHVVSTGQAEISGVTIDVSHDFSDYWTLNGNLTVQSPRDSITKKMLNRRSDSYGMLNLLYSRDKYKFSVELTGASERYDDAANLYKMSGYALLNLTANYSIQPEWNLELRANNILDKDYVLAYATSPSIPYNTAGANIFIGLRYQMQP